jgi:hypothetical protein
LAHPTEEDCTTIFKDFNFSERGDSPPLLHHDCNWIHCINMVTYQNSRTALYIVGTGHGDRPPEIQQPKEKDRDPIRNGATWSPYSGAGINRPPTLHQIFKTISVEVFHANII